jgi:hypothetical protein
VFAPRQVSTYVETLKLSERPYQEEIDEKESYVKIGDPVVQVMGEEFISAEKE